MAASEGALEPVIEAVLFDLDGTLYDRDRLAAELFAEQYTLFAGELPGIRHCRLSDDTRDTLAALRARKLKLGVITNGGGEMQRLKLLGLGLERAFDTVLVSEDEGVRKPDAEFSGARSRVSRAREPRDLRR